MPVEQFSSLDGDNSVMLHFLKPPTPEFYEFLGMFFTKRYAIRIALSCLAFIAVSGFAVLIAWLAGFNFDHRGPAVGEVSYYILVASGFAAFMAWSFSDD